MTSNEQHNEISTQPRYAGQVTPSAKSSPGVTKFQPTKKRSAAPKIEQLATQLTTNPTKSKPPIKITGQANITVEHHQPKPIERRRRGVSITGQQPKIIGQTEHCTPQI